MLKEKVLLNDQLTEESHLWHLSIILSSSEEKLNLILQVMIL